MRYAQIKRRENPEGIYILSKGCSPFFIPKNLLIEFDYTYYFEQESIDEDQYNQLKTINEIYLCRKKALDLLARREHTVLELKFKLKKRKFSRNAIDHSIPYLLEKKYLSEERFSQSFILSKNKKGEGKFLILQRLQKKGISSSKALEYYEEEIDFDMEINACIKSMMKLCTKKDLSNEELFYKLKTKGFNYSIIKEAYQIYFDEKNKDTFF